jgi:hypothetical protein
MTPILLSYLLGYGVQLNVKEKYTSYEEKKLRHMILKNVFFTLTLMSVLYSLYTLE